MNAGHSRHHHEPTSVPTAVAVVVVLVRFGVHHAVVDLKRGEGTHPCHLAPESVV